MDIGFSPFATRPAQVESVDDWLGEPRDSSLPLDGPVGTPAFPVQRRADDLLPPAEDSYEETRATLSPESHSESMGEAYGLFTEGLGGGPDAAGIGVEGGGQAVSVAGDGQHVLGADSPNGVTDSSDEFSAAADVLDAIAENSQDHGSETVLGDEGEVGDDDAGSAGGDAGSASAGADDAAGDGVDEDSDSLDDAPADDSAGASIATETDGSERSRRPAAYIASAPQHVSGPSAEAERSENRSARATQSQRARSDGDRAGRSRKPQSRTSVQNTYMVVTVYRGRTQVKRWEGNTQWMGDKGRSYRGTVRNGHVSWTGGAKVDGVKVRTDENGHGGIPIEEWIPKNGTRVVVTVSTGYGGGKGTGTDGEATGAGGSGSGQGGQVGGDGDGEQDTTNIKDDVPGSVDVTENADGTITLDGTGGTGDTTTTSTDTTSTTGGEVSGDVSTTAETGSDADGVTDGTKNQGGTGWDDGRETGSGIAVGRTYGDSSGAKGGTTVEKGGVAKASASRVTGVKFGGKEGAIRGDGKKSDDGARGAMALFGGLVGVSRAMRPIVEAAFILEDISPAAFAKSLMKKSFKKFSAAAVRKKLANQARAYATNRMATKVVPKLAASKAFRKLSKAERKLLAQRIEFGIQRSYMKKVGKGASGEVRRLKGVTKKVDGKALRIAEKDLRRAQAVKEAADVQVVAGRLPQNHKWAGKRYPQGKIPKKYRDEGLHFTSDGFPDFLPHAKRLPNGKMSVQIKLTGDFAQDVKLANAAAGFKGAKRPGYTWHHHQDGKTMILVPTDLHNKVAHTGGQARFKEMTGDLTAYPKGER